MLQGESTGAGKKRGNTGEREGVGGVEQGSGMLGHLQGLKRKARSVRIQGRDE